MEFTNPVDPTARYHVVTPLFFNDDLVGILDGDAVTGTVARAMVLAVRCEPRSSFKHPVAGLLLGVLLVGAAYWPLRGAPIANWWAILVLSKWLIASLFLFVFGAWLLWEVITRRDEPWIVFVTATRERAFPLKTDLKPQAIAVLHVLFPNAVDASLPWRCLNCEYDLTGNTSGRCPECGEHLSAEMQQGLGCERSVPPQD